MGGRGGGGEGIFEYSNRFLYVRTTSTTPYHKMEILGAIC